MIRRIQTRAAAKKQKMAEELAGGSKRLEAFLNFENQRGNFSTYQFKKKATISFQRTIQFSKKVIFTFSDERFGTSFGCHRF